MASLGYCLSGHDRGIRVDRQGSPQGLIDLVQRKPQFEDMNGLERGDPRRECRVSPGERGEPVQCTKGIYRRPELANVRSLDDGGLREQWIVREASGEGGRE